MAIGLAWTQFGCGSGPPPDKYFTSPEAIEAAEAIARRRPAELARMISGGLDVDHRGRIGMNLLKWSLFSNCLECFETLLEAGASTEHFVAGEYTGKIEQTPLMPLMQLAAGAPDPAFLTLALKHGGDPDARDVYGDRTVMYYAILHSRMENLRLLVEAGADLNHRDWALKSPLMAAVGYGNYELACFLLDEGADPSLPNNRGRTVADRVKQFGEFVRPDQREWLLRFKDRLGRRD